MKRHDAEKIITEYLKPVFGFALKRCKNPHDAEDLSQEIILRAFRALLCRDDIEDHAKFIWTVAHNALCNYYRDGEKSIIGIPIDDVAELIADEDLPFDDTEDSDALCRLQSEIAYLSKLQRRIVIAYYFENRRQADIARLLNIPVGTVKWHLFEAKKELKRGMDTMRKTSELKFNPIKFQAFGINGSAGTKDLSDIVRSPLVQNICYCVRNEAKTTGEIADALGVSPVYIEGEVDFLAEYGFLKEQKGKYIADFIIGEPSAALLTMKDKMYKKTAGLFAGELYDELMRGDILDDDGISCGMTGAYSADGKPLRDKNFILWSLIPYIAAWSGEKPADESISFEEVATIRPDGGKNICHADIADENMVLPDDYVYMRNWCGPMWSHYGKNILWQINSEWSERGNDLISYSDNAKRVISMYERGEENPLSADDMAWLSELGYIRTKRADDGQITCTWQIVVLKNKEIKEKLLAIGDRLKEKYKAEFDVAKAPYIEAVLAGTPAHLRKTAEYELQFIFDSDGWFLLHCIVALLDAGKLRLPKEE
ncbi:MAG: sigma-70 family RNA polymerase sigma factor [Ruminococcus sp.]|nr:sigma-70 family RNA polymerase sigma factor [Candidatus Apopatosoma intestinale]